MSVQDNYNSDLIIGILRANYALHLGCSAGQAQCNKNEDSKKKIIEQEVGMRLQEAPRQED